MSLDATNWAWKQALKSTDKIVLLSMADRAGEDHTCYPSVTRLANDAGLNRKTVLNVLKRLREMGLIAKTGRTVGYNNSVPEYALVGVRGREDEAPSPKGNQAQNRDMYQTQKVTMSTSGHSPKSTMHQTQNRDGHQSQKWDTESFIESPIESPKESYSCAEVESTSTPDAVLCTLPLNDGSDFKVMESFVAEIAPLYPNVDVPQALRAMKGWLIGNSRKRKTRRGIKAFITSWLSREQDKPRTVQQNGSVGQGAQPRSYRDCVDLEQRQETSYLQQLQEKLDATSEHGTNQIGARTTQPAIASVEPVSRGRA